MCLCGHDNFTPMCTHTQTHTHLSCYPLPDTRHMTARTGYHTVSTHLAYQQWSQHSHTKARESSASSAA